MSIDSKFPESPLEKHLLSGEKILSIADIVKIWNKSESKPFWNVFNFSYPHVENLFYTYLQQKYGHLKGIRIIMESSPDIRIRSKYIPFINIPISIEFRSIMYQHNDPLFVSDNLSLLISRHINNPNVNLIIIPLVSRNRTGEKGHAVSVIINKILNTIEYYDSVGYSVYDNIQYREHFVVQGYKKVMEYLSSLPPLANFNFLEVWETNPFFGIQRYEKMHFDKIPKKFQRGGFCIIFAIMIIHYRIIYPQIPPYELMRIFLKKIGGVDIDAFNDLSQSESRDHGYNITTFLLNYLMYISEKVNQPEVFQELKSKYPSMILNSFRENTLPFTRTKFS